MSSFMVIPRLVARHINLIQGNAVVSPHSMTAISLFLHAMGRKTGAFPEAFAVVQHDAWLDADVMDGYGNYHAWQRRGAMLVDKKDFIGSSNTLSLQPVITGNVEFSLVVRYQGTAPAKQDVVRFLNSARFQGGEIPRVGSPSFFETESLAKRSLRTGKWIVDRRDRLENQSDPIEEMMRICLMRDPEESLESEEAKDANGEENEEVRYSVKWSAATVGYALLTEPSVFPNTRNAESGRVPAAYAEAMTGLVGMYSVHDPRITAIPFWESGFVQDDVFLVRGFSPIMEKEG